MLLPIRGGHDRSDCCAAGVRSIAMMQACLVLGRVGDLDAREHRLLAGFGAATPSRKGRSGLASPDAILPVRCGEIPRHLSSPPH